MDPGEVDGQSANGKMELWRKCYYKVKSEYEDQLSWWARMRLHIYSVN